LLKSNNVSKKSPVSNVNNALPPVVVVERTVPVVVVANPTVSMSTSKTTLLSPLLVLLPLK
jgi:hypothetical protein